MRVSAIGGTLLIETAGPLGPRPAARVRSHIDRAREGGRPIVLDLSAAEELSNEALAMLRAEWRALGDRRLRVVAPAGSDAAEALKAAGLRRFVVHATLSGALAAA